MLLKPHSPRFFNLFITKLNGPKGLKWVGAVYGGRGKITNKIFNNFHLGDSTSYGIFSSNSFCDALSNAEDQSKFLGNYLQNRQQ